MIWTVILKSGDHFVIHGSSFDRNVEVRKHLKARGKCDTEVAGIVQGNHHVERYMTSRNGTLFSKQLKAALTPPDIEGFDIADKVMDEIAAMKDERQFPVDGNGRPFNDPSEW